MRLDREERPDDRDREDPRFGVDELEPGRLWEVQRTGDLGAADPATAEHEVRDDDEVERAGDLQHDLGGGNGVEQRAESRVRRDQERADPERRSDHVRNGRPEPEPHPRGP